MPSPSGKSLYEEIGSRLGYRICVLCAEWKKGSLWVTLKNEGFSAVCQKTDLLLIRECDEGKEQKVQKVPYEICGLKGGQTDVAKVEIAAGEDDGEGKKRRNSTFPWCGRKTENRCRLRMKAREAGS